MPVKSKYVFPIARTNDVCLLQTTVGAANLSINGLLNAKNGTLSFINQGYSRSVSLTSAGNLSARTFSITGVQNGITVTENITGPNANTVYGVGVYDSILSISVNGVVATAVQVGTGYLGFFPLININLYRPVISYALSTAKLTAVSIATIIYNTVDNIDNNGLSFQDNIANNTNVFVIKASNADDQFILPTANITVCGSILISIVGDAASIGNSICMNFIQV